ncbi:MAG: hypothetical protein AAF699_11675 [Pseudomonadota bacterium]
MKTLVIAAIACCIAVALYTFVQPGVEEEGSSGDKLPDRELTKIEPIQGAPRASVTSPPAIPEKAERLMQRMESLQAELSEVVAKRQQAEAALLQAEQDVTDLENYVEAIKSRGEEPTDYTEEGMDRFLPAFEAYQQAVLDFEASTAAEETIMTQLSEVEKALAEHWSTPVSAN